MGEDGTYLLYHIIADTQSTASTASRNALNAIVTINFKENGWDISRLHTSFDSFVATLVVAGEEPTNSMQLLYLMNAYRANSDNEDWIAHVCNMDLQITLQTITDMAQLQENATSDSEIMRSICCKFWHFNCWTFSGFVCRLH